MSSNPRWAAVAAFLFVALAATAHAQSTASLRGRVTDEQGAVVAGAQIAVKNQATGEERSTVSDRQGEYLVPALPVGSYRLEVQSTGFQVAVVQNLRVEVAQAAVQNVKLSVSGRTEEVAVVGETPAIETVTTSFGTVIDQKTVQEIPLNGRHFVDLGLLIPGSVAPQPATGFLTAPLRGQGSFAFNTAGNREDTVNFMINGINLNDQVQNQITFQPSINTVAEFKVDNSTLSAEYGRSSGAVVNIATRSGTNEYHGEAFEFFRDESLDARNYFNPESQPQSTFNRNQFGVNLGGPIIKNKTFFFLSYEGLRQRQGLDFNSGVLSDAERAAVTDPVVRNLLPLIPTANAVGSRGEARFIGTGTAPVDIDQFTGDVSHQFGPSDRVHAYYAWQRDERGEPNLQGNTIPDFGDTRASHRQIGTFNYTHIFGRRSSTRRASASIESTSPSRPTCSENPLDYGINNGIDEALVLPQITVQGVGLNFGGPAGFPQGRTDTTYVLADTLSWAKAATRSSSAASTAASTTSTSATTAAPSPTRASRTSRPGAEPLSLSRSETSTATSPSRPSGSSCRTTSASARTSASSSACATTATSRRPRRRTASSTSTLELPSSCRWASGPRQDLRRQGQLPAAHRRHLGSLRRREDLGARRLLDPERPAGDERRLAHGRQPADRHAAHVHGTGGVDPPRQRDRGRRAAGLAPASVDAGFRNPSMQTWNVNVQREFFRNMTFTLGYFGSKGEHLRVSRNVNQFLIDTNTRPYPRIAGTSPIQPLSNVGNITEITSAGRSRYKGLWFTLQQRLKGGLQFNGSYTLAKSEDTNSLNSQPVVVQDSTDIQNDFAPSDYDVKHRYVLSAIWELPFKGSQLKEGWQVAIVTQGQTGNPINILTNLNFTGNANIRPDLVGNLVVTGDPNGWYSNAVCDPRVAGSCTSSSVFALPVGPNHFGNLARNAVRGPGFYNTDFSIIKRTRISKATLELRAEAFNVFNHPNLGNPSLAGRTATVGSTSFGLITSTRLPTGDAGSARQIQFAAKLLF